MGKHFMGEIIQAAWTVTPEDWAPCDGSLLNIADHPDLFRLLETRFGGDGETTFGLPNLQGKVIVGADGDTFTSGDAGGEYAHTLTSGEMPAHEHALRASSGTGVFTTPTGNTLSDTNDTNVVPYRSTAPDVSMHADSIDAAGGGQPHNNMQPYLVLNFFICLRGCYPVQ